MAWKKCCGPIKEGGLGIRNIHDIVAAFSMKLWWNLRSSNSLWAEFMKKKLGCQKHITDCEKKVGTSTIWQRMLKVKNNAEILNGF